MAALAGIHADRIGNLKSPLAKFGADIFGGAGGKKSGGMELGFSAFARQTTTTSGKGVWGSA